MDSLEIMRWVASVSGIVAALMVSYNGGAKVTGLGFIVFTLSSIIWVTAALIDGNSPLAVQNIVLLAINIFGIYRYLWPLRQSSREETRADA
ncbi:MAG: hypothetical protein AAF291_00480 [Pseudomonadota bacterium]